MSRPNQRLPPLNVAVFAHTNLVALVRLDTDTAERDAADAVASGFAYAGCIGVNEGEVAVSCEPGFKVAIARGGYIFAGLLGEHLKAHQLERPGEHSWTPPQP